MTDMLTLISSGKTISNAAGMQSQREVATQERQDAIETHYHRTMKKWKRASDLVERWAEQLEL